MDNASAPARGPHEDHGLIGSARPVNILKYLYSKAVKVARGSALRQSRIDPTSRVHSGTNAYQLFMARHSYCGYDCTFNACDVGPFCSIASRVTVGGVAHPAHFVSTSPVFLSHRDSVKAKFAKHDFLPLPRTTIGADVWIGDGAFIKAGVTVGHGAIIGMGAVVTRDVAPYSVVAGNPARLIKMRFDPQTVEALLELSWWEWPDERLHALGPYINNPQTFIQKATAK